MLIMRNVLFDEFTAINKEKLRLVTFEFLRIT